MARIAVIGSGVAGLVSAYYLSKTHHVDLFESESRIGGHTHTHLVSDTLGKQLAVDTGFIVFNESNYPCFLEFISELGVAYQDSDMSFSFTSADQKFFWGSDFPKGIFSQRRRWVQPTYYRFLMGIHRFNKQCLADFDAGISSTFTLGDYIEHRDIPRDVVTHYVLPMTSAIWSGSFEDSLKFPMVSFIRFWKNHQLLEIGKGLPWKTIVGGSHSYIQKVLPRISGSIFKGTSIHNISRDGDEICLTAPTMTLHYDAVVVATHADTALKLLAQPNDTQIELLGPWRYSLNRTVLHTDSVVMPPRQSAWCSWNVRQMPYNEFDSPVSVSYWMNRLQNLESTTQYFVTLNDVDGIHPDKIIREMRYTHPIMSRDTMATQTDLPLLNHNSRIVFCGSYFGYGFHEDAVASAFSAVESLIETLGVGRIKESV